MGSLLLPGALIAYIIGIFLAATGILGQSETGRRGAPAVYAAAWVLHLGVILRLAIETGRLPITNAAEYLLVFGWALVALYLIVWARWRVDVLGLVLPPLATVAGLFALGWLDGPSEGPQLGDGWFLFHTALSTVGMAILGVSFAMSLLYLIQDNALKSKRRLGVLERLPSLERCDRIGVVSLVLGFLLLTLGIITGIVVTAHVHGTLFVIGAKQAFSVLAWVVFAGILLARSWLGFRGRRSAVLVIAGFGLGLMTVVGMTL